MNIELGQKIAADSSATAPTSGLSRNLSGLVESTESLLKDVAASTGESLSHARAGAQERLQSVELAVNRKYSEASERLQHAVERSEKYIHTHPWGALGVSAAIGLLIGLLTRKL